MLSVVIIGFIWQLILSPLWGIAKGALSAFGLGGLFAPWLGLESTALVTVSLISVWQFVGIPMMLIYAALLNIPDDLVDAATVDGANQWHVFWYDQAAADPAHARHRLDPDLRRQLQRLRPDLHDQGRARRAELRDRHPRHVLLPHLLRLPAAARQPDHGRHGRDHDAAHHPGRRAASISSASSAACSATLREGRGMNKQRASRLAVHAALILYTLLAIGPILLDRDELVQVAQGDLRHAAAACRSDDLLARSATIRCSAKPISASTSQQPDRHRRLAGRSCSSSAPWPPGR